MRFCASAVGLLLAALSFGAAPVPMPDNFYMQPGKLIAVEGARRLNLSCLGQGSPVVLFDAGMGDSSLVWRLVQGEVAKRTRACAYDRAGIGFSDPRQGPSDARAAVADLHALLAAAKIRTPILYVGHSMAGLYGVLLQATHPGDLGGAVLVDPSFADQWDRMSAAGIAAGVAPATIDALLTALHAGVARLKQCASFASPLPEDCARPDRRLPPALAAFQQTQNARASYLLTKASENDSFLSTKTDKNLDQKELEAVTPGFGDKVLIVLTRGNEQPNPGLSTEQSAAVDRAWGEGHDRLAALSTHGRNKIVPASGHYIQIDQPQAVIDAVDEALAQMRGR